jgi:hypothetical protein
MDMRISFASPNIAGIFRLGSFLLFTCSVHKRRRSEPIGGLDKAEADSKNKAEFKCPSVVNGLNSIQFSGASCASVGRKIDRDLVFNDHLSLAVEPKRGRVFMSLETSGVNFFGGRSMR